MKKLVLYSVLTLIYMNSFAQSKFGIYTELSQNICLYFNIGGGLFSESDVNIGGEFKKKSNIFLYVKYRFGGYVSTYSSPSTLSPYEFYYSALGGGMKFVFIPGRKVKPFIRIDGLTAAISSNNKARNFYIDQSNRPINNSGGGVHPYYYSTPFIGNVYGGIDWNVVTNFNITFGLGISGRIVKTYYNYPWFHGMSKKFMYGVNAQLGFSYTFLMNKYDKQH